MFKFISNIIPETKDAYIVGGSVRDRLLGRSPTDYDVAVSKDPERFAKIIATNFQGRIVELGKPGQLIIRVVSGDNTFDISYINGVSIEDDLNKRDFSINAMAYALSSGEIIDCLGGMQDLADKKIRMVSKNAFRKDPIRLIRAFRIGSMLDFEIEPQTVSIIKDDAKLIRNSAGERIKAEFFKMLRMQKSYYYLSQMADVGLLFEIFPELGKVKGCSQNRYHLYDVFEHTMKAYYHLEAIFNDYSRFMSEFIDQKISDMDEGKTALCKYSILLHDIGKPSVRTVDKKGNVHFYGHGAKSADMAKKISRRLKLSTREDRFIDFIIRNHLRPLLLFDANRKKTLTRKGTTRFFMKCGDNTPDILLHSIADVMGKDNGGNKAFLEFAKGLMRKFYSDFRPKISEPPLISGHDLIDEYKLAPSPLFKKVLGHVEEARLSGEITDRQDALKLVKEFL